MIGPPVKVGGVVLDYRCFLYKLGLFCGILHNGSGRGWYIVTFGGTHRVRNKVRWQSLWCLC